MLRISGLELLSIVKERANNLPFIVMTGEPTVEGIDIKKVINFIF
jgi:DNA-binding NtrC family response regulator